VSAKLEDAPPIITIGGSDFHDSIARIPVDPLCRSQIAHGPLIQQDTPATSMLYPYFPLTHHGFVIFGISWIEN
jgi:hypothetical protein